MEEYLSRRKEFPDRWFLLSEVVKPRLVLPLPAWEPSVSRLSLLPGTLRNPAALNLAALKSTDSVSDPSEYLGCDS